jgi:hypothetical protein
MSLARPGLTSTTFCASSRNSHRCAGARALRSPRSTSKSKPGSRYTGKRASLVERTDRTCSAVSALSSCDRGSAEPASSWRRLLRSSDTALAPSIIFSSRAVHDSTVGGHDAWQFSRAAWAWLVPSGRAARSRSATRWPERLVDQAQRLKAR